MKSLCKPSATLLIFLAFSTIAYTQTITGTTAAGLIWSGSNNQVTITGYTSTLSGTVSIPATINAFTVTTIGMSAFQNCQSITFVTISSSVTSIKSGAFVNCNKLGGITISNGVTSIGNQAFWLCSILSSVSIPASVTSISSAAFASCVNLASITVDPLNSVYTSSSDGVLFNKAQNTLIQCPGGKTGSYTIPTSVTSIADYAFCSCQSLTSVTIPSSVTSIGRSVFLQCTKMTSVTIPSSILSIGYGAFSSCGLTSLSIPDSVTSIANSAFQDCTKIPSVTISRYVTSIGTDSFGGCTSMTSITVDPLNAVYCSSPDGVLFNKAQTTLIQCPAGMIGSYAPPSSVTSITDSAFDICSSLTNITIPPNVTSIGNVVFNGCSKLTSITIPNKVTSIGNFAFMNCDNLKTTVFTGNAPIMGTSVFISAGSGFNVYYFNGATGFASPTWTDSSGDNYTSAVIVPPAALSATSGTGIGQIVLKWSASSWAQSYLLQRSTTSGGGYSPLATVSSGTTYIDNDPSLVAGESYYYEIAGSVTGGTSAYSAPVFAVTYDPPTYGGWAYKYFGLNAPANLAGVTADPAQDGISNLMKYALGANLNTTAVRVLPTIGTTSVSGTNYLLLTFPQNPTATDITYAVQGSSDLSNWSTISTCSSGVWSPSNNVTQTSGTTTVQDTTPITSRTKRFMRLQVTH